MRPVKIGLIGAGKIAHASHIPAFKEIGPLAKVTSVYDISKEAALKIKSEHIPDATVFESIAPFLASDIEAVIISTPNNTHYSLAHFALEAGLHVLVEKPMATTLEDADALISYAQNKQLILQVNQTLRYTPDYTLIKETIAKGVIGNPLHIRCIRASAASPDKLWSPGAKWFLSKEACGGVVMDIAVHMADLMIWYFGPVRQLSSTCHILNPESEVTDHTATWLEFDNGATGTLELSWAYPRDVSLLEIFGDRGSIRLSPTGLEFAEGNADFTPLVEPGHSPKDAHTYFLEAIRDGTPTPSPGQIGRDALSLCLAIEKSSQIQSPVKPNLLLHSRDLR